MDLPTWPDAVLVRYLREHYISQLPSWKQPSQANMAFCTRSLSPAAKSAILTQHITLMFLHFFWGLDRFMQHG